jgi:hypothetical protein
MEGIKPSKLMEMRGSPSRVANRVAAIEMRSRSKVVAHGTAVEDFKKDTGHKQFLDAQQNVKSMNLDLGKLKAIQRQKQMLGSMHRLGYEVDGANLTEALHKSSYVEPESPAGKLMKSLMESPRAANPKKRNKTVFGSKEEPQMSFREMAEKCMNDEPLHGRSPKSPVEQLRIIPRPTEKLGSPGRRASFSRSKTPLTPGSITDTAHAAMKKEFVDTLNPSKISDFKKALDQLDDYLDGQDPDMERVRQLREGLKQGAAPNMQDISQLFEVVDKTLTDFSKIKISSAKKDESETMKFHEWCQLQHDQITVFKRLNERHQRRKHKNMGKLYQSNFGGDKAESFDQL